MFVIISSMYTTVVITFDRYLAVSKPIQSFVEKDEDNWKRLFYRVAPVMLTSFILTVPQCFEFYVAPMCFVCLNDRQKEDWNMSICSNSTVMRWNPTEEQIIDCDNANMKEDFKSNVDTNCYFRTILKLQWNPIRLDKTYNIVYRTLMLNVITYVIPLIMLFVLNWLIYNHLRRRRQVVKSLGKNKM